MGDAAAEFNVTLVAVLFTIFFFVSPFEAGIKIYKAKDAGQFSAFPSIVAAACCISQVYYAACCILRNHDGDALWLNFGVNAFGFVVQEFLLVFHYAYNVDSKKIAGQNFVMLLLMIAFFLFLELGLRGNVPLMFQWWKAQQTYLNVCSMVAVVINISMYGAPLAIMGTVVRTKSVEFMPLTPSIFVCCASICWMTEGLMLGDITFWLPNAIGLALGLFQLALYAKYRTNQVTPAREALVPQAISLQA